jgi:hypothetical protein
MLSKLRASNFRASVLVHLTDSGTALTSGEMPDWCKKSRDVDDCFHRLQLRCVQLVASKQRDTNDTRSRIVAHLVSPERVFETSNLLKRCSTYHIPAGLAESTIGSAARVGRW